ncbi:MAG: metal ABC transporter permease [Candidatus Sungbacteria bacterium]|uniref:High-affinity zinc uptake system membrane protein ZnuB n=1 Tax=Candidatus Sungiibacteriota bacterium TaxID=2750080 RepID=A0A931WMW5_9BACT|nr:metal ABC transporter permease [Candidatus Sungbacteria bacterium]
MGAFLFLFAAALLILGIERRTDLPVDAIVGVLFTASLAAGILLTPEPELLEALFGDFTKITPLGAGLTVTASLAVVIVMAKIMRPVTFSIIAPDLGHVSQLKTKTASLLFLAMLALVVALGVKFVGTLLMGTLTIIPAASAKNVARTLLGFCLASVLFAALAVLVGMGAAYYFGILAGPAIILSGVLIFLLTLVSRPFV